MTRPRRAVPLLVATVLLAGVPAGCGDDVAAPEEGTWSTSGTPLDPAALTWAVDGTVHVGDVVVETGRPIEEYVVAGDSVWFVPEDADDDALWRADAGGAEATDAHAADLLASADGRYLSFFDEVTGPRDGYGTPQAQTVVVDLQEGREVVRSTDGMGDTGDDDLADLYEDAEFSNLGFPGGRTALVDTTDGTRAFDLATGEGREVAQAERDERYDERGLLLDPTRSWVLGRESLDNGLLPVGAGPAVRPRTGFPSWSLVRWLPDGRAVGVGFAGRPDELGVIDPDVTRTLLTCTVQGACTTVAASTGTRTILLPRSRASS